MRKRVVIDGTPDEVKVSCPVWRGGKSGDNFKGLPITIGKYLRRLRSRQPDSRNTLRGIGETHSTLGNGHPEQGQTVSDHADDLAATHNPGRTEGHAKGQFHCCQDRHPSHAGAAPALSGLGYPLREAL